MAVGVPPQPECRLALEFFWVSGIGEFRVFRVPPLGFWV